jgi:hypothetical protein
MTVLDLIKRSMRLLTAINVGDVPTDEEAEDGLLALNSMVDAWGTERLTMYASTRALYAIVAGQQSYSIGRGTSPVADYVADRPMYIDAAGLVIAQSDPTQTLERPIHIIRTDTEWARVRLKGETSTLPIALYYQSSWPNGEIVFWPAPTNNNILALYTPTAVSEFTSLTQVISLPPGYRRALPYNLAADFGPEFGVNKVPDNVLRIADESKRSLKRANVKIDFLRVDKALRSNGGGFDWQLGEPR